MSSKSFLINDCARQQKDDVVGTSMKENTSPLPQSSTTLIINIIITIIMIIMIRTTICDDTIEDTTMIFNITIPMNIYNNDIDEEASYSYTI